MRQPELVRQTLLAMAAGLLSAILFWFGTGLRPYWWCLWIAPAPILLVAPRLPLSIAWIPAFLAFSLGGVNSWSYLRHTVFLPLAVCILAMTAPALVFAAAVILFRHFIMREQPIAASLVFPAAWVAFEFIFESLSANGTWGNLAYTQLDFLPVVQLAAFTGVWGISFVVLLFSAFIAAAIYAQKRRRRLLLLFALLFPALLGWGAWRAQSVPASKSLNVGLISSDLQDNIFPRENNTGIELARKYADRVDALAARGAAVVVVPEKIAFLSDAAVTEADAVFAAAARRNRLYLVYGIDHRTGDKIFNQARLFAPSGDLIAVYDKHHLVPVFERGNTPGSDRKLLSLNLGLTALTICKDMDFPLLSRQYGSDGVAIMLVPAWDFTVDRWLHSRMALMRGVEGGFNIARAAKQGLLTLSDNRGRVLGQRSSEELPFAEMVGSIPVAHANTAYTRFGDWFGWLDLVLLAGLIAFLATGLTKSGRETVRLARGDLSGMALRD
jgi:apolipoprotein N-acyltransferase